MQTAAAEPPAVPSQASLGPRTILDGHSLVVFGRLLIQEPLLQAVYLCTMLDYEIIYG